MRTIIVKLFIAIGASIIFAGGIFFVLHYLFVQEFFLSKRDYGDLIEIMSDANIEELLPWVIFWISSGLFLICSCLWALTGSKILSLYIRGLLIVVGIGIVSWITILPKSLPSCPNSEYLKNVFFVFQGNLRHFQKLPYAHPWDFSCKQDAVYDGLSSKYVYMSGSVVEGAHPYGFRELDSGYAVDRNSVFFNGEKISDADSSSFTVMYVVNNKGELLPQYKIGKDKNYIFMGKNKYSVDMATFKFVAGFFSHAYFVDKNTVYWTYFGGQLFPIENVNPLTFTVLGDFVIKDDKNVFFIGENENGGIIPGVDLQSFRYVGGDDDTPVTADKNHVYYGLSIVEKLNPRKIEALGNNFYKNQTQIYAAGVGIITGIDFETFSCEKFSCSDNNFEYVIQWGLDGTLNRYYSLLKRPKGTTNDWIVHEK